MTLGTKTEKMEIGAKRTRKRGASSRAHSAGCLQRRAPEGVGSGGDMGVWAYSGLTMKTAGNDGEGGKMRPKEDQKGGGVGRLAQGKLALVLRNQPGPER